MVEHMPKIRRLVRDEDLVQPWRLDKTIKKSEPALWLEGEESNARKFGVKESYGKLVLRNESDDVDELVVDPGAGKTTIYRDAYAPRFFGEKDWFFDTGLVSLTIGTGGNFAETTLLDISGTDYRNLLPLAAHVEVGGTVASGETIDVEVWAYDDQGNAYGPLASYSVTGTTGSKDQVIDFTKLLGIADGRRIVKITAKARTNQTSTDATASARVVGVKS